MSDLFKVFRRFYYVGCYVVLAYMAASQIARYCQNEDTPIIQFHKFTSDTYPTYTLCFEDNAEGGIYAGISMDNKKNLTVCG